VSGRVVGRVFERVVGSAVEKAVLVCLAEHSNPDGEMSFPSARRISQETEFSERSVRAALATLRERRLIIQTHAAGQHRPATYRVNLLAVSALQLVQVYAEPGVQDAPSGVQDAPSRGAGRAVQGCTTCTQTVLEPSLNRQEPSGVGPGRPSLARPSNNHPRDLGGKRSKYRGGLPGAKSRTEDAVEAWLRERAKTNGRSLPR
jgi:hypothetical protein